jgi:hypothetical protein
MARDALVLANEVEAHGWRWSIRILGLPAPSEEGENTHAAKLVVINLLKSRLNINHIALSDIDCCHRVNDVKDDKQMMLTRFFARDLVDHILVCRKNLKATGITILDDTTYLNRQLLIKLKAIKCVHSSWCARGKIWAKMSENGKKFKIAIDDNVGEVLKKHMKAPKYKKKAETTESDMNSTTSHQTHPTPINSPLASPLNSTNIENPSDPIHPVSPHIPIKTPHADSLLKAGNQPSTSLPLTQPDLSIK